jgi:hypothetical protein
MKLSKTFINGLESVGLIEPADYPAIAAASEEAGLKGGKGYSIGYIATIIKGAPTRPALVKLIIEYYEQKKQDYITILNETA